MMEDSALSDKGHPRAISLQKKVTIALFAMGSSAEYGTIGDLFGFSKSTGCTTLLNFSTEVWAIMKPTDNRTV